MFFFNLIKLHMQIVSLLQYYSHHVILRYLHYCLVLMSHHVFVLFYWLYHFYSCSVILSLLHGADVITDLLTSTQNFYSTGCRVGNRMIINSQSVFIFFFSFYFFLLVTPSLTLDLILSITVECLLNRGTIWRQMYWCYHIW